MSEKGTLPMCDLYIAGIARAVPVSDEIFLNAKQTQQTVYVFQGGSFVRLLETKHTGINRASPGSTLWN